MDLSIRKLTTGNIDDFLYFFDEIAFCDNPDWADCYCCFFYFPDDNEFGIRSGKDNRDTSVFMIESGRMNGYLAYLDGKPVGWCNADSVENYPRIMVDKNIEYDKTKKTAAVVCFVTDVKHRKKGIAKSLLLEVCEDFRKQDFDYLEAYPRKNQDNDALNYHGPIGMFLSEGFTINKELEDYFIVRKQIS